MSSTKRYMMDRTFEEETAHTKARGILMDKADAVMAKVQVNTEEIRSLLHDLVMAGVQYANLGPEEYLKRVGRKEPNVDEVLAEVGRKILTDGIVKPPA